ncbi:MULTISPECIES: hypothetical protein [Haloferax]|uniref:Uncharacterized protein n=1 Tax=Haloferax marinum TaxID=2666143 RepID=A0A6A8G9D1_9EURY|nr:MULTISPECIES: hypothetical protein [Haloferax]KAB1198713.1 hypothetical protein Hfx1150_14765 [Haloferax sp. CBA1150]MRW97830.1 hypothetical protein [Haloferax marinum]
MRRPLLAVVAVLLVVGGGVTVAFATGFGPFAGGADSSDQPTEPFPTQTPTATQTPTSGGSGDAGGSDGNDGGDGSSSGDGSTPTTESSSPPFVVTIDRIEQCGQTCRDVTSTLTNQQDADATGVTVYSRIFVGNSTAAEDEVWRGSQEVGDLDAGESFTTTRRVELSFSEAFAVQQADGWITVQTTIQTDQQTLTYTERRDVT